MRIEYPAERAYFSLGEQRPDLENRPEEAAIPPQVTCAGVSDGESIKEKNLPPERALHTDI